MSKNRISAEPFASFEGDFDSIAARIQSGVEKNDIVHALTAAIVAQELTRIEVTKIKMDIGQRSDFDKGQLVAYWRVLGDHYEGSRAGKAFVKGVEHLEKLSSEEATDVVYEIRRMVKPELDREMEETELKLHLDLPLLGKFGVGKFRWTARGPLVAIRKFRIRMLRWLFEGVIWASVLLGAVHWLTWTIFDQPYLAQSFVGIAKVVQFVLLALTTTLVLGLWLANSRSWPRTAILCGGWSVLAIGWVSWLMWVVFGRTIDGVIVEGVKQIGLLVFVLSGGFACWVVQRILNPADAEKHDT